MEQAKKKPEPKKKLVTKIAAVVLGIVGLLAGTYSTLAYFGVTSRGTRADVNQRVFVDSETLQPVFVTLKPNEPFPVTSPAGNPMYPAEKCYWTKDGKIKSQPTYVLLNDWLHPGTHEPTFCPDCGRLVVPRNPIPQPGDRPPPTHEEYYATHPALSTQ